jgi:hypothetical protein
MDAKQPVKVVGGKPLTYEVQGEVIEAVKGAEKTAVKLAGLLAYDQPRRSGNRYVMAGVLSEAGLQARLFHAYVQGRADEAATRGDSK